VYNTVRKQIGRGVWINDYKKEFADDTFNDNSNILDNSQDLLKKELKILDSLGKSSNKA
jgi:hypothetical protein